MNLLEGKALTLKKQYVGRRIKHQHFGNGIIRDVRRGGREYFIDFVDTLVRMWLGSSEVVLFDLQGLDDLQTEVDVGENIESLLSLANRNFQITRPEKFGDDPSLVSARKMIEAFRLGVVPYNEMENFTYHRDNERDLLFTSLNKVEKTGGIVRMIRGEYGSGKTHFLEYIKQIALKDGWVVATTEFDSLEIRPQEPKAVYHSLMLTLRAKKGGDCSIIELLKHAVSIPEIYQSIKELDHPFLSRLFNILRHSHHFSENILWQWFLGAHITIPFVRKYCDDKKLPSLLKYYSHAPIVCNILSGLSVIFNKMGYKGLMILIDESESIANISKYYQDKADNFIKGLKLTTLGTRRSRIKNEELAHPSRGVDLNYIFQEKSFLATIFAMTPRPDESETILEELIPIEWRIDLKAFEEKNFVKLVERLAEIHNLAYETSYLVTNEDLDRMIKYLFYTKESEYPTVRLKIKFIIEILDIMKFHPERSVESIISTIDNFSFLFTKTPAGGNEA